MKFLLASWGSSGDLNPFLAIGRALRERGHEATLVGNPNWKSDALSAGIDFVPAGPALGIDDLFEHRDIMEPKNLGLNSLRGMMEFGVLPMLDDTYRILTELAPSHDALLAHQIILHAGVVSEKTGIPWASATFAPCAIPSRYTVPTGALFQPFTGIAGRIANQALWKTGLMLCRPIFDPPLNAIRKREGLPPMRDVIIESTSKTLNLLLFSELFAPRPPDWSDEKKLTGFCIWDPPQTYEPPAALTQFLNDGPKPWLFTLGTSAIASPQGFYTAAAEGMRGLKERAILLVGDKRNVPASVPDNVLVLDYAPYGWLMPRCRAVAHQCGMGTTAQALRAGIPAVACPYAFDQPSNAMRLEALGVGKHLPKNKRTAAGLIAAMREVSDGKFAQNARDLGEKSRTENGAQRVCELLEEHFTARLHSSSSKIYGFLEGLAIL